MASIAGKHIKKTVLELGGSDPFIVMPSADLDAAVQTAVTARTINNGQSCIAAKRFIVAAPIADEFIKRFVERMRAVVVGDPMDERTNVGPLATAQIRDDLDDQVQRSVTGGARLLLGGKPRDGAGFFYEPTVLADVHRRFTGVPRRDVRAGRQRSSARVTSTMRSGSRTTRDSVSAAAAWTRDAGEVERFSRELAAGAVFINGMVASDPRFPFGGVKKSGYGRELSGHGIREFTNIKTVRVLGGAITTSGSE